MHDMPKNLNLAQAAYASRKIRQTLALPHYGLDWTENVPWVRQHESGDIPTCDNLEFAVVYRNEETETRALEVLTDPATPFVVVKQTATRIFVRVECAK